jgi:hypothetical protein
LLTADVRKFKHVLHKWFIQLVDGRTIEFTNTWDKDDENPLKGDLDKGDFYLVCKMLVKGFKFETYNPEDEKEKKTIGDSFVKVPKSEIARIYEEKEEIMA